MATPWPADEDLPDEAARRLQRAELDAAREALLDLATRVFVGLADVRWLTASALGEGRPPVEPSTMTVLRLVRGAEVETLRHIADVLDELRLVLSILLARQGDVADRPALPPV